MKILITGGFGFIGTALLPLLKNHEIVVIDNLLSGAELKYPNVEFIYGDIRNKRLLARLKIESYDVVIHMAAIVGEPACQVNDEFSTDINVCGTYNITERLGPNQLFICMSTSSVYGTVDSSVKVTEDVKPQPINLYGRQKYISEYFTKTCDATYIILRPATAFGVSKRIRLDLLINTLAFEALSTHKIELFEPDLIRPMIHVCDLARFIKYAIDGNTDVNTIYNLGNPSLTLTKRNLVTYIANMTDSAIVESNQVSLDPRNYDIDFNKLLDTGFDFNYGIHNGIEQIAANLKYLMQDPKKYNTPAMVREFIKQYGTFI
jgi:nucleoside-diphosphate-sugar epimerase